MKEVTKRTGKHIITDYELSHMERQKPNLKRFNPHKLPDALVYQQMIENRKVAN